jgi:hypothetical protein
MTDERLQMTVKQVTDGRLQMTVKKPRKSSGFRIIGNQQSMTDHP